MVKRATRTSWRTSWHSIETSVTVFPHPASLILSSMSSCSPLTSSASFFTYSMAEGPFNDQRCVILLDPRDSSFSPHFQQSGFFVFLEMALPALSARCLTHAYKHVHALRLGDSCYCAQPQGSISKTAQGITLPTACRKEDRNMQTGIWWVLSWNTSAKNLK